MSKSRCHCRPCMQQAVHKAGEAASLLVAVRVRPVLGFEVDRGRNVKDIIRVMDDRMVLVMDPDSTNSKDYLDQVANRSKVSSSLESEHFVGRFFLIAGSRLTVLGVEILLFAPAIKHAFVTAHATIQTPARSSEQQRMACQWPCSGKQVAAVMKL